MSRQAFAAYQDRRRQDAARHRGRSARVRRHRTRRNGDHRGAPRRDGNGRPHQPADDRGRGNGSRLVAREGRSRRMATRSKFGNQDTDGSRSTRHYLMPMRQIGASARDDARRPPPPSAGACRRAEVKAVNHEVVHSASGRRLGFGELAADAAKEPVPSVEGLKLKNPKRLPLSRQGPDRHRRPPRYHGRHGALRCRYRAFPA